MRVTKEKQKLRDEIPTENNKLTNLLKWLIVHKNPWHKSKWGFNLSSFPTIFSFNLCMQCIKPKFPIHEDFNSEIMKQFLYI